MAAVHNLLASFYPDIPPELSGHADKVGFTLCVDYLKYAPQQLVSLPIRLVGTSSRTWTEENLVADLV